jgi:outer membrane lipoprotein-sorting protein
MEFSDIVENPKVGHDRFEINPPPGTHVNDMVGEAPPPKPQP